MQKVDYTKLGGLFTYQDTLEFMQNAYDLPLRAFAAFAGEKFVLSGCAVDAGTTIVADGWIVVNGEVMQFTGGDFAAASKVIINTVLGDEGFDDGTLKQVYEVKSASLGNIGGFDYSELKRLPYNADSIGDYADKINTILQAIIQFEPEVILDGCEVTAITVGPDTCDISAGLILFDGKLISSPAYSGSYPAYLKEDGGWVTAVPGAGLYITFDPHTSQRYKNVLDRATVPSGRIIMEETLSDRFDPVTFIGRWEMKGYQLLSSLQGRVPVGLWFDGVPVANVTDPLYNAAGPAVQGGEKGHTLIDTEHGSYKFKVSKDDIGGGGAEVIAQLKVNGLEILRDGPGNQGGYGSERTINPNNDAQPHENRQPFTVIVYAKRS